MFFATVFLEEKQSKIKYTFRTGKEHTDLFKHMQCECIHSNRSISFQMKYIKSHALIN